MRRLKRIHSTCTIILAFALVYTLISNFSYRSQLREDETEGFDLKYERFQDYHLLDREREFQLKSGASESGQSFEGKSQLIVDGSVPRGQSFFYVTSESRRLGSFESWRPKHLVRRNTRPVNSYKDTDNIFVSMQTSSVSMWNMIPMQLLTTFQKFPSFGIYGNFADSIGGVEIVNVFDSIDKDILNRIRDFEPYLILTSIRESHIIVPPDDAAIPGMNKLNRFVTLPMLLQTYREHPHHEWYLIVDDKISLFSENLRKYLKKLDSTKPYYLGRAVKGREHIFASIDSGIVISQGLMQKMFGSTRSNRIEELIYDYYTKSTQLECCGDYMLGKFLENEVGIQLDLEASGSYFEADSLAELKARANNWCAPIFTLGNQRLRDMELISEYIDVKVSSPVLHSDIYLDFIKPYLPSESQLNWDNGANDIEFGPGHDYSTTAHRSHAECRKACDDIQHCVMYRYDTYTQYCGLGISSVALGGPILRYKLGREPDICGRFGTRCENRRADQALVSDWMVDRIRSMRLSLSCDFLNIDPLSEGSEYGALDQVEGWWHRAKSLALDNF